MNTTDPKKTSIQQSDQHLASPTEPVNNPKTEPKAEPRMEPKEFPKTGSPDTAPKAPIADPKAK